MERAKIGLESRKYLASESSNCYQQLEGMLRSKTIIVVKRPKE